VTYQQKFRSWLHAFSLEPVHTIVKAERVFSELGLNEEQAQKIMNDSGVNQYMEALVIYWWDDMIVRGGLIIGEYKRNLLRVD